jgi:glycosyltransferase involved in cell wall biosynthesis
MAGDRLTVLTLVDGIGFGGGERLAAEVAKRLDPSRFERILCVTRWSAERRFPIRLAARDELQAAGVRFLGLERASAANLREWRPIVSLIRNEPVDVLHAHKFGSNLWASLLGLVARPPVVVAHEHTWSYEGQLLRRLADRFVIARRADAFVAVSREDRRRMIEIEGIDPAKIRFIPNGIAAEPGEPPGDPRGELGIAPDAPVIGAVGALRPQKAYPNLIHAAASLRPRFPGLRVLIVGDGPERVRLEGLISELGLEECVTILGHRGDVPALLRAMDVAVVASDFEGSPLSVMEYMEAARPVIATRVGGVPDLVDEGVNGLLVEPGDPEALAAAAAQLLDDPERASRMGAAGRELRRREFDIDVTVRRIQELYEELWARKQAAPRSGA